MCRQLHTNYLPYIEVIAVCKTNEKKNLYSTSCISQSSSNKQAIKSIPTPGFNHPVPSYSSLHPPPLLFCIPHRTLQRINQLLNLPFPPVPADNQSRPNYQSIRLLRRKLTRRTETPTHTPSPSTNLLSFSVHPPYRPYPTAPPVTYTPVILRSRSNSRKHTLNPESVNETMIPAGILNRMKRF